MPNQTKNVFISHIHKDDEGLTDLKNLLKSKGMDVRDSSITNDKPNNANSPEYIKSAILGPRIDWAGCMIVYIFARNQEQRMGELGNRKGAQAGQDHRRSVGARCQRLRGSRGTG